MRRASAVVAVMLALIASACSKREVTLKDVPGTCDETVVETDRGRGHVQPPEQVQYPSDPPTSGKHYPQPSRTGVLTVAPATETLVHNLEHGHVVVWYRPDAVRGDALDAVEHVVTEYDTRAVLVAHPNRFTNAGATLVITAWARKQECSATSDALAFHVAAFIRLFAGKGPEGDIPGTPVG